MKTPFVPAPSLRFLLGVVLAFCGALRAAHAEEEVLLTPQDVDQLMGPIALYPDALVALILPASTVPADIVLAQRYLSTGGDPDQIDNQPWTDSVKGLARYPMLIQWLDENLTWTRQLGSAFLAQPDDLMNSVQRLRAVAKANGTLTSTDQQKLVLDGDVIEIVPAQPDVIYVPYYDPVLVYGPRPYYGAPPYVTFGVGFSVGYWLSYDCNWHNRVIVVGDRHHNWHTNHDWNRHHGPGGKPNYGKNWRPWTPPVNRTPHARPESPRPRPGGIIHPRPLPRGPGNSPRDQHPEHPRTGANSRPPDHNRPSPPPNSPGVTPPNPDRRPPSSGPRPDYRPQPGEPRPPGRTNPSPGPRPNPTNPRNAPPPPMPLPPAATPNPQPRQPPPQGPGARPAPSPQPPGAQPPPAPRPSKPAPPPPTKQAPKDNPRDDKPDVQH